MQDFLNQISQSVETLPPYALPTTLAFLGTALVILVVYELVAKKWRLRAKDARAVLAWLLAILAFLPSLIDYIVAAPGTNAVITIGGNTFALAGLAIFIRGAVVSPFYKNIVKSLSDLLKQQKSQKRATEAQPIVPPLDIEGDSNTFKV